MKVDRFHFVIGGIKLAEGQKKSIVTILKLGKFWDPRYDDFTVDQPLFDSFLKNFGARVYAQDLPIDIGHSGDAGGGAAGWIKRLWQEGKRLRAEVEWTDLGIDAIMKRGFKYLSAEYWENFIDNETKTNHGATLLGAALTIRPVIKGMDPITLSTLSSAFGEQLEGAVLLHEDTIKQLTEERRMKKEAYLAKLRKALAEVAGLPATMLKQLSKGAETLITGEEKEEEIAGIVKDQVQLAESMAAEVKQLAAPTQGLSAADIQRMIDAGIETSRRAETNAAKQLSEKKTANLKVLSDSIAAAQGIEVDEKKELSEALAAAITGSETEEQIKTMVALQVKLSEKATAKAKLAAMGFNAPGYVRVEGEGERGVKKFSEHLDTVMGFDKMPESERFKHTGKLMPMNKKFAEKVLKLYDFRYAAELAEEGMRAQKLLAGGNVGIADTNLPYSVMRTVLREALFDLQAGNFVNIDTDQGVNEKGEISPTVFIPFLKRQSGNPTYAGMTVFEGNPIPNAGWVQDAEFGYVNPRKLGIAFTNESAFFSRVGRIDYDVVRDNVELVTRLVKELMEILLITEVVMASDEYSVVAVVNESRTAQVDGAHTTFQLAYYPLVKQRKIFDLKGTQVGATVNPITVVLGGTTLTPYDGTGNQANGNYYNVSNYSLGQIQIVNQAGAVQTPANATTLVVSYSYTTNVTIFNKNLTAAPPNTKREDWLNTLLQIFGRSKASLYETRFAKPNYAYMSAVMNQLISEASEFESARNVPGQALANDGNLEMVKAVPCFGSNVPLPQIGDLRIIMGERYMSTQKIVKPWAIAAPVQEIFDSTGKFLGKKGTYGEQYDSIVTPAILKQRTTQILVADLTTDIGPF